MRILRSDIYAIIVHCLIRVPSIEFESAHDEEGVSVLDRISIADRVGQAGGALAPAHGREGKDLDLEEIIFSR